MRLLILNIFVLIAMTGCTESEPSRYTGNRVEYALFQSSDFSYSGTLEVLELSSGELEFNIRLSGARGNESVSFPAHLHFGDYQQKDAQIAAMLQPVNSATLSSKTIVNQLSDGTVLNFERLKIFAGHVKIHLAAEGPEYSIILVSGNVGINSSNADTFDPTKISVCSNSF